MQQSYGIWVQLFPYLFQVLQTSVWPFPAKTNLVAVTLPVCSVSLHQSEYLPDMKLESGRAGLENTPFLSLVAIFFQISPCYFIIFNKKASDPNKSCTPRQYRQEVGSSCVILCHCTCKEKCFPRSRLSVAPRSVEPVIVFKKGRHVWTCMANRKDVTFHRRLDI